jgi:hypothetical protein
LVIGIRKRTSPSAKSGARPSAARLDHVAQRREAVREVSGQVDDTAVRDHAETVLSGGVKGRDAGWLGHERLLN